MVSPTSPLPRRRRRLLDSARGLLGRQQALDLRRREAGCATQLLDRGLGAVGLLVVAAGGPDLREAPAARSQSATGRVSSATSSCIAFRTQNDASAQTAFPARRRTADGEQQPGDTLLDQLGALDPAAPVVAAGDPGDGRQERLHQLPAGRRIARFGRHDEILLPP